MSWWNMWGGGNTTLTTYDILNDASVTQDRYTRDSDNENSYGGLTANLGFKQIFVRSKHELTVDGQMSRNDGDNENISTKVFLMNPGQPDELTVNMVDDKNRSLRFSVDYIRPLGKTNLNMGMGAQRRSQEYDNDLQIFADPDVEAPTGGTHTLYKYDEVYRWGYVTLSRTVGKFGLQAGVRAELATSEFELPLNDQTLDNDYNSIFPNLNVSYTVKPGNVFRIGYRKTIGRPSPWVMNPYVPSTDPLNISVGNPDIRPSYTHNFTTNMSWSLQQFTLTAGPYYRRTVDAWDRIRTVDSVGVSTMRWENVATAQYYGSNFSVSVRPTGKLSGSLNYGLFRDVRDGSNLGAQYKSAHWRWSVGGYGSFRFNKTLTAQANLNYMAAQSLLQGRQSGYTWSSIGLRQQLFGTKGSINLNISDPLALTKYNFETRDATHIQNSRSSVKARVINLGFSYNFGKPPEQMLRRDSGEGASTGAPIQIR